MKMQDVLSDLQQDGHCGLTSGRNVIQKKEASFIGRSRFGASRHSSYGVVCLWGKCIPFSALLCSSEKVVIKITPNTQSTQYAG